MIEVNNNCGLIICILILVSVFSIILFLNWYATYQTNKEVTRWGARVEKCKIDRYEKKYRGLERWEIKDRLNNGNRIVMVCDLPDDIAEKIIDYSLKLIEEEMK